MRVSLLSTVALVAMSSLLISCNSDSKSSDNTASVQEVRAPGSVNPEIWPKAESPVGLDPAMEARITELMSKMTLRHKVGQVIQADVGSIGPEDVRTYPLGSILNGGNSAPNGDNRSPASAWVKLADEFYDGCGAWPQ